VIRYQHFNGGEPKEFRLQSRRRDIPKNRERRDLFHRFKERRSRIAVGGDYTKSSETTGTAAWSSDDGLHWSASTTPPHGYRSAVQWSEALRAWIAVGTNGSDISRDDGKTRQSLDNGNWNALSLPFVVAPTVASPG